jgi:replicative DNA helicase
MSAAGASQCNTLPAEAVFCLFLSRSALQSYLKRVDYKGMSEEENQLDPFDEVKRLVSLEDYFSEHVGVSFRPEGNRLAACCPWHDEKTPSFKVSPEDGFFRCYGACDYGGSIIDAVIKNEAQETPVDALKWLNEKYRLGLKLGEWKHTEKMAEAKKKIAAAQTEMADSSSAVATAARELLNERGFTSETQEFFNLAVDKNAARILIPIYEKGGHPIGWSGRSLYDSWDCKSCGAKIKSAQAFNQRADAHSENGGEGPVYKDAAAVAAGRKCPECSAEEAVPALLAGQFPKYKDSVGYKKGSNLYNLHNAKKALRSQKNPGERQPLMLMEGFADVWACHQAGFPGAVAYNGNSLTAQQATELVVTARSMDRWVGILLDNDSTGRIKADRNIRAIQEAARAIDQAAEAEVREREGKLSYQERRRREETRVQTPLRGIDVRVLWGVDLLHYGEGDERQDCKDAGEVLQYCGAEELSRLLSDHWWSADEFRIRQILEGEWDSTEQKDLVRGILREARHTIILDGLVPLLAESWGIEDEGVVRKFMHDSANSGANLAEARSLMADIDQMHESAREYLATRFVISTDYDALNETLPGDGFRLGQLMMILGRSGTGKTTLIANMIWQFIRRQQAPCIFFSLEQPQAQVFIQLVQISLGIKGPEAERMILEDDPRLNEVKDLFREYLVVVDNVPDASGEVQAMTPGRIRDMIHDINMARGGEPIKVVAVDHLGIMEADKDASQQAQDSTSMASGYVMKKCFGIAKQTQTFFIMLQQMSASGSPPGTPVTASSSRGSTEAIDYSDYIMGIWRPELEAEISDDEKIARRGLYCVQLVKNRHGPSDRVIKLVFDHEKRRITPESTLGIPAAFLPQTDSADLSAATGQNVELMPITDGGSDAQSQVVQEALAHSDSETDSESPPPADQTPDWFFQ